MKRRRLIPLLVLTTLAAVWLDWNRPLPRAERFVAAHGAEL